MLVASDDTTARGVIRCKSAHRASGIRVPNGSAAALGIALEKNTASGPYLVSAVSDLARLPARIVAEQAMPLETASLLRVAFPTWAVESKREAR